MHLFSVEETLRYVPFYNDFGPLNLGCLYRYCKLVIEKLKVVCTHTRVRAPRAELVAHRTRSSAITAWCTT